MLEVPIRAFFSIIGLRFDTHNILKRPDLKLVKGINSKAILSFNTTRTRKEPRFNKAFTALKQKHLR